MIRRTLAVAVIGAATAAALSGCGTDEPRPITSAYVASIFEKDGATDAVCKPREGTTDETMCRLTMEPGRFQVIVITGTLDKWTSKPCVVAEGCEGWKP